MGVLQFDKNRCVWIVNNLSADDLQTVQEVWGEDKILFSSFSLQKRKKHRIRSISMLVTK
jgi:hypothetical protein